MSDVDKNEIESIIDDSIKELNALVRSTAKNGVIPPNTFKLTENGWMIVNEDSSKEVQLDECIQ